MRNVKNPVVRSTKTLLSLIIAALVCYGSAIEAAPFLEQNGVVVMEVESTPAVGKWESRTTIKGFSGTAYYHPTANYTSAGGTDLLSYEFTISSAGVYQAQVRSRIGEGTSMTDFNDSWIRLVDSKNQVVNLVANGNSVSANGWLKFYQNKVNVWTWQTSNKDNDPKSMSWTLAANTTYKFQVSMRSSGHAIDKIVLWNATPKVFGDKQGMVSSAQQTELEALPLSKTEMTSVLSKGKIDKTTFAVRRVSHKNYAIVNPFSTPFRIHLIAMNGQVVRKEEGLNQSVYTMAFPNSASGLVVFQISNGSRMLCQTMFVE